LALARLEQVPVIDRGKPLAEVIDIAEQSKDLRLAQAPPCGAVDSWLIQLP
jgi:hypothetical protein